MIPRLPILPIIMLVFAILMSGVLAACSKTITHNLSGYQVSAQLPIGWQVSDKELTDDVLVVDRKSNEEGIGSIWAQLLPTDGMEEDLLAVWETKAEWYADHYPDAVLSDPVLTTLYGYVAARGTIFSERKISKEPGPGEFVAELWNRTLREIVLIDLEGRYLVIGSLISINTPDLLHTTTEEKTNRVAAEVDSIIKSLKIEPPK
jgi:hypothetical protein